MSAAAIAFNPELHEYRVAGAVLPSVTQILGDTGVSVDFDELAGMSHRLGLAISDKRDLGHALHADAHAYDDGDLVWSTVDPRVRPYLDAWVTFRRDTGLVPLTRERRLFHPTLRYCGTLDGVFKHPDGRLILPDLKTGNPEDAGAQYQTAAYQLAFAVDHPDLSIAERWSIQLTPEHRTPYRITRYSDFRDFATWQAIVATYYAQASRRRTA